MKAHDEELTKIPTEDDGSETENTSTQIRQYEISSYPADYTIATLLSKYKKTIIIPEFQRDYVWSKDVIKQSRLIESIMLNLPIPQIFLFQRKESKDLLIIDGYQRLNTIYRFHNNEFELKGVDKELEGKTYETFSDEQKEFFDNSVIRSIIIRQLAPQDEYSSMYYIFERLNTGGIVLSPMEIRKAIFYGKFYKKLEKFNQNENWKQLINRSEPEYRLRDIEWLLRVIYFYSIDISNYDEPLKDRLNEFMSKNKENEFSETFCTLDDTINQILSELGPKPFHIPARRLNLAALDSIIVTLMKNRNIENLREKFNQLIQDRDFIREIQSRDATKRTNTINRFQKVREYLQ